MIGDAYAEKKSFFRLESCEWLVDYVKYIWKLNSKKNFEKNFRHLRA